MKHNFLFATSLFAIAGCTESSHTADHSAPAFVPPIPVTGLYSAVHFAPSNGGTKLKEDYLFIAPNGYLTAYAARPGDTPGEACFEFARGSDANSALQGLTLERGVSPQGKLAYLVTVKTDIFGLVVGSGRANPEWFVRGSKRNITATAAGPQSTVIGDDGSYTVSGLPLVWPTLSDIRSHMCGNGAGHSENHAAVAASSRKLDSSDVNTQRQLGLIYLRGDGVPTDDAQALIWLRKAADQGDGEAVAQLRAMHRRSTKEEDPDNSQSNEGGKLAVNASGQRIDPSDIETERQLGLMYQEGDGTQKDGVEAVIWFRKAADQGDMVSEARLGTIYLNGAKGVAPDKAQATIWLQKAAEQGDVLSAFTLGNVYAPTDHAQAIAWFRKAADLGSLGAELILAKDYSVGYLVAKDEAQGMFWYHKAAERNSGEAQYSLGTIYAEGLGVPRDMVEALVWLHKAADHPETKTRATAYIERIEHKIPSLVSIPPNFDAIRGQAEQGNAEAQYKLGLLYEDDGTAIKDITQAAQWIRKSAEQGFPRAEASLATLYLNGTGVQTDLSQYVIWLRKAAADGDAEAQFTTSVYLEGGFVDTRRDEPQSLVWLRRSADQGYPLAEARLALAYFEGKRVPKDIDQAVVLYRKAAVAGDATAQLALAQLYESGTGVPKDEAQALTWYHKVIPVTPSMKSTVDGAISRLEKRKLQGAQTFDPMRDA